MFGTTDIDHMPESFLTDPAVWDAFVGQVWQAVLAPLHLPTYGCVIEIAPGSAAKIGHALAAQHFSGELHIVEAAPAALEKLLRHYRQLIPMAKLYPYAATLAECSGDLPRHADAVLASHIIDDMLVNACAVSDDTFAWAQNYSDAITPQTRAAFENLQQHSAQAVSDVSQELAQTIAVLTPRHVVFSQYPSVTLHDNGLDALNNYALRVLENIHTALATDYTTDECGTGLGSLPHYHNRHIGLNVLNPQYWLSCTRKS